MDSPSGSKRSRLKKWARGAKDDVKHGWEKVLGSSSTPRPSTPGPRSRRANRGVEERSDPNEAAKPTNEDALQATAIASPTPIRPQSIPPNLLEAASQHEHISSAAPVASSIEAREVYPIVEPSPTVFPGLAQHNSTPSAQEVARTGQSQAPVALPETIPIDIPVAYSPPAPETSTLADPQPPSDMRPLDSPPNIQTRGQWAKQKPASPWYAGVKATLALVERATDVFPPLKSTVAAINGILEVYDNLGDNKRDFERLAERVKLVDAILRSSPPNAPQEFKDRRDGLERTLSDLAEALEAKRNRTLPERMAHHKDDQQDILRLIREVSCAIEIAMLDVTVRNEGLILEAVKGIDWLKDRYVEEFTRLQEPISRMVRDIAELRKAEILKSLGEARYFAFSRGTRRRMCVPGSRIGLLSKMMTWAGDRRTEHAFWLCGMAGTGKTAVSETFCSQLSKRRLLGASFFCSLTDQELSDPYLIIPTLAKALAKVRPEFGSALMEILDEELQGDMNPLEMPVAEQYELLILRPAEKAFENFDSTVILSVDALDECKNKAAVRELVQAVLSKKPPQALKVFFTSRPESVIQEPATSPSSPFHPQSLRLHDIERDIVTADINLFVAHELQNIQPLQDAYHGDGALLQEAHSAIVKRSGTLFIVAATIMRYIGDEAGDAVQRCHRFCRSDASVPSGIHPLYWGILETAFGPLDQEEKENTLSCLSLLVVALRPLSVTEYSGLLDLPIHTIWAAFRSLHSVVQVPPNSHDNDPISIYHASFADFLTDQQSTTASSSPWTVDQLTAHSMVAEHCFRIMNTELRFNIANIPSSFVLDCDNPHLPTEVEQNIPPHVHYSCQAWSQHLSMVIPDPMHPLMAILSGFIQLKVLFWIEAMNLLNSALQCNPDLCKASEWLERHDHKDSLSLAQQLRSIGSFALYFIISPASQSTPHLYISSLATSPSHLGLVPIWKNHFPGIPTLQVHGSQSMSLMSINVGSKVRGVAVSLDGKHIASGSEDGLVTIWDAQNGKEVKVLEGHSGQVNSVAFSGDGQHLASGSDDHLVCLWDVSAGKEEKVLHGHTDKVNSVAFSNSGNQLVSGSGDGTVRVWDTTMGTENIVLHGHSRAVHSVTFLPDGAQIVSGSTDKTVRVWDWRLGKELMVLKGHTQKVRSVTFSSDGMWIASGSDDQSVRVWDARSGQEERVIQGHTFSVQSVSFSRDGTQIISGSSDRTLRLWDAATGKELQVLHGHTSGVMSAVFSSDGSRIVSGSKDQSIWVWDRTGAQVEGQKLQHHTGYVNSVAVSEDGICVVSGSDDGSVGVLDGKTGEQLKRLDGHTMGVKSVALSPDGTHIASGSHDKSVRVWNVATGEELLVLQGHTGAVYTVAFSPDGACIVSGSQDKTVRIWDVVTGEELTVLEGHTDTVLSAKFSSDGGWIASGSGDDTVRIWDVTKKQQLKVLNGHKYRVRSVAFSPEGTRVASGSGDKTVCIWNVEAGAPQSVLSGHTDLVFSVAFSPSGTQVASGSMDCTVRAWDLTTGEHLVLQGHKSWVRSVALSRDGTWVVSGSEDKTIRVWNLAGLSYTSEIIENEATGWLLAHDNQQNRLMYVPLALVPQSPCCLIISGNSTVPSFSSPPTFSFDTIGDNWQKCFTPLP